MNILEELFKLKEDSYGDFIYKLTPNISRDTIIGIRMPILRKFAKSIKDTNEAKEFIKVLPHKYYEENLLHSFLISEIKDYNTCLYEVERYIPYMTNWADSDTLNPKVFSKHLDEFLPRVLEYTKSKEIYVCRFGIIMLMRYYLKDKYYKEEYLYLVKDISLDDYYIKMMKAWYYATALIDHYDDVVKLLKSNELDKWTHNKAISKAKESFRIDSIKKEELSLLRRK